MGNYVITGSNRGIGFEFVKQLAARGEKVFATCRTPSDASDLNLLANKRKHAITVLPLDVTDDASIAAARKEVGRRVDSVDVLINNAAIYPRLSNFDTLTRDQLQSTLDTNTFGPMMVTQAFLDLLKVRRQSKIVNISSHLGSINNRKDGQFFPYSTSKAALNMMTRLLAFDLLRDGIIVVAMNPGWVRTDMGRSEAPLAPSESVRGMLRLIDGLTAMSAGRFLVWNGSQLPW